MNIISKKTLENFASLHPTASSAPYSCYKTVSKTKFSNYNELKAMFPSADVVKNAKGDNLTVFNIHGNDVRLIASIHYNRNRLYIRHILTHPEYDKEKWKK